MATTCLANSKHTCNMTKTDQYLENCLPGKQRLSWKIIEVIVQVHFNDMTSFWLVQRQTPSAKTSILTANTDKNTEGEKYVKVDERHNSRRSRKNAEKISQAHQKTRYSSQIGLIYLKPVVYYSTSVYFHSNNDFPEEPRSPKDIRYDIALVFLNLILLIN